MPDTDFANPATVDGQPQNLTGDIIPPGGTDSALPFARSGSNFLADSGYDPAKSEGVQHDLAGVAEKARDAGSFADRQAATRADKYQSDMESAYALERSSADDPALKPWNAEEERSKMVRGPIEQFGSIGTIFAMAASAFTRRPMVSALNAGAAAMNAMKQSDEKAYNSAFEAWKDNSQLAIKRFNMEREMFEDVNKLSTSNMAEWRMKRAAIAAQFEDTKTLALLDAGMDPTVLKLDAERVTTFGKMQENQKAMFQMKAEQDLYNSYIQAHTPEGKKLQEMPPLEQLKVKAGALQAVMESRRLQYGRATAGGGVGGAPRPGSVNDDRVKMDADIRKEHPDWSDAQVIEERNKRLKSSTITPSGNKQVELQDRIYKFQHSEEYIDRVIHELETHAASAGIAGKAMRLEERFSNMVSAGAIKDSDRVQMMRDVELLRTWGKELLTSKNDRLKSTGERIDNIIAGTTTGDTTPNTLRALKDLKILYAKMKGETEQELHGGSAPAVAPATAPPASSKMPWDNLPIKQSAGATP